MRFLVVLWLEKIASLVFSNYKDQSEGCLHTVYIGKGEKKKDNMKCSSKVVCSLLASYFDGISDQYRSLIYAKLYILWGE